MIPKNPMKKLLKLPNMSIRSMLISFPMYQIANNMAKKIISYFINSGVHGLFNKATPN
jgi:hypothetical protein